MSFTNTCSSEESSSDEPERYKESKNQICKVSSKINDKLTASSLRLLNKKKVVPEKKLYYSTFNGTKIKISYVNPNLGKSVDDKDDTQGVKTSSKIRKMQRKSTLKDTEENAIDCIVISSESEDSLTYYEPNLPKNKKIISKKRARNSIAKRKKRKIYNDDSNKKMSSYKTCVAQKSQLNNSENSVKFERSIQIEPECNGISTTSDSSLPLQKKVVSRMRISDFISKQEKEEICNDDPVMSFVHNDDTRLFTTFPNTRSNVSLDKLKNVEESVQTNEAVLESNENLTAENLILSSKKKKKKENSVSYIIPKKTKRDYVDSGVEASVVHEDETQVCIKSCNTRSMKQKSLFYDLENNRQIKRCSEVNSEREDKLINCDSIFLPVKKSGISKKRDHRIIPEKTLHKKYSANTDIESSVVPKDYTKILESSNTSRCIAQKPLLDDSENSKKIPQSIKNDLKSNDFMTVNDLVFPRKKNGCPKSKKLKQTISKVNLSTEIPTFQDDAQKPIASNPKNVEEELLLEDTENIKKFEKSNKVFFKDNEKLTNYELSSLSKKKDVSNKSVHHSTPRRSIRNVCNIELDLETLFSNDNATQEICPSSNTKTIRQETPLNNPKNIVNVEQSIEANSKHNEKLSAAGLIFSNKKKKLANKNANLSTSKKSKRQLHDVNSNIETSVIHKNDSQVCRISNNTSSIEQPSSLDDSENVEEFGQSSAVADSKSKEKFSNNSFNSFKSSKVVSNKRVHFYNPERTKRKISDVDSDSETSSNMRTGEQSPLNCTNNILNVKQSTEADSKNNKMLTTNDANFPFQKKVVSCKRVFDSITKEKMSETSNVNITLSEKSRTNNPKLNLEKLTMSEIQPIVLMEVLNDSLLEKSSIKMIKTTDKNFMADKQIPETIYASSKPTKSLLKAKNFPSCKTSPCRSSNLKSISRYGRKIKRKMYSNYEEDLRKKYKKKISNLCTKYEKSAEEDCNKNNEMNKLFERNSQTKDSSTIVSLKTTKITNESPVASLQLVNDNIPKEIQCCCSTNKTNGLPTLLHDVVLDTSSNIEIDWVKVESISNQLAKINLLQKEVDLLDWVHKLRSSLRTTHANYEMALESLQQLHDLKINAFMLLKNTDVLDTIVKVTQYVGNVRKWNLSKQEVLEHSEKACQIRFKAFQVFNMFKSLFIVPDGQTFKEVYIKEVQNFLAKTKVESC